MPRTNSLLVFARAPRPGRAKTRLIPRLGAEGAAALHARLIEHTLETAQRAAVAPPELHATPADDSFLRGCATRFGVALVAQADGDLGARMHAALALRVRQGRCALLIGTDCPALDADCLHRAQDALDAGADAVFAPAEDGGYALIGLARCDRSLFENMPWGTAEVMSATRARLRALGWNWYELETLWDVDRPADYERLLASGLLSDLAARA